MVAMNYEEMTFDRTMAEIEDGMHLRVFRKHEGLWVALQNPVSPNAQHQNVSTDPAENATYSASASTADATHIEQGVLNDMSPNGSSAEPNWDSPTLGFQSELETREHQERTPSFGRVVLSCAWGAATKIGQTIKNGHESASTTIKAHTSGTIFEKFLYGDESRYRIGRKASALVLVGALAISAHSMVTPDTHKSHAETVQTDKSVKTRDKKYQELNSHLVEEDKKKEGAWVPPGVKLWHAAVESHIADINLSKKLMDIGQPPIIVDSRIMLAYITAVSGGDYTAAGLKGRKGLTQITDETGKHIFEMLGKPAYNPNNADDNILAGMVDFNFHYATAYLSGKPQGKTGRADLIKGAIIGLTPGQGVDPDPDSANKLFPLVTQFDADWLQPTSGAFNTWAPTAKFYLDKANKVAASVPGGQ